MPQIQKNFLMILYTHVKLQAPLFHPVSGSLLLPSVCLQTNNGDGIYINHALSGLSGSFSPHTDHQTPLLAFWCFDILYTAYSGLPRWFNDKESTCQCRRHRFNPWIGKIPWRRKCNPLQDSWDFPGGSDGKASAYNARDLGSIPRLRGSPGEGNGHSLLYSCLENPRDRGAWQLQSMGSQELDTTE